MKLFLAGAACVGLITISGCSNNNNLVEEATENEIDPHEEIAALEEQYDIPAPVMAKENIPEDVEEPLPELELSQVESLFAHLHAFQEEEEASAYTFIEDYPTEMQQGDLYLIQLANPDDLEGTEENESLYRIYGLQVNHDSSEDEIEIFEARTQGIPGIEWVSKASGAYFDEASGQLKFSDDGLWEADFILEEKYISIRHGDQHEGGIEGDGLLERP